MPKCILLVGVPASGKSTFIDTWVDTNDYEILSTDNIIQSWAEQQGLTYDQAFGDRIKIADREFWDSISSAADAGKNMVIDRTNLSVKSRKKIIDHVGKQGYEFEAYVFPTPDAVEWEKRLNNRPGKTIPKNILASMKSNFNMPTEDEGFTLISIVS